MTEEDGEEHIKDNHEFEYHDTRMLIYDPEFTGDPVW